MKAILEITYQTKEGKIAGFNSVEMTCSPSLALQFAKGYKNEATLNVYEIIVLNEDREVFGVIR